MTISHLRCELNTNEPIGIFRHTGKMNYLWQITIDGRLVADRTMPFSPSDDWIELEADRKHLERGDGHQLVYVRRIGEYVVWFQRFSTALGGSIRGLDEEIYVFEWDQYAEATLFCLYQDSAVLRHASDLIGGQPTQ